MKFARALLILGGIMVTGAASHSAFAELAVEATAPSVRSFVCTVISDGLIRPPETFFNIQIDLDDATYSAEKHAIHARVRRFENQSSPPLFDRILVFKEACDAPRASGFQYCRLLAQSDGLFGGKANIEMFGYAKPRDLPGFDQLWVTPAQHGVEYANGRCESGRFQRL